MLKEFYEECLCTKRTRPGVAQSLLSHLVWSIWPYVEGRNATFAVSQIKVEKKNKQNQIALNEGMVNILLVQHKTSQNIQVEMGSWIVNWKEGSQKQEPSFSNHREDKS